MYSQQSYGSYGLSAAPSNAPPPIEPLVNDFPSDSFGNNPLFTDRIISDSSDEDDMTLGPDSDSLDQGAHSASAASLHLQDVYHPSHRMTPPSHLSDYQPMIQTSASPNMIATGAQTSPAPTFTIPRHLMHSMANMYDLPSPSNRSKRSASESEPVIGVLEGVPMKKRGSVGGGVVPVKPDPSSPRGADGYFYRSRDKTNYSQAHKGTLPSPPTTPDAQKRIRCTWTLDETRVLYDLLKDTSIEEFPDAPHIRSHLLRFDPNCNKTLDHVRNKKANLLQKAHSKGLTVAEILINDMNKLHAEASGAMGPGSNPRSSFSLSSSSSSMMSFSPGLEATSPRALASSSASHRVSASPRSSSTVRPNRRRPTKRSPPSALMASSQAQTATAQQIAKMSASSQAQQGQMQQSQLQQGQYQPSFSSSTPSSSQPSSGPTSQQPSPGSVANPTPPAQLMPTLPYPSLNGNGTLPSNNNNTMIGPSSASNYGGGIVIGPSTTHSSILNQHHMTAVVELTPSTKPPMATTLPRNHYPMISQPTLSNDDQWKQSMVDCMGKLVSSMNEMRSHMRLQPLDVTLPPTSSQSAYSMQRMPIANQWITTPWNSGPDSADSETNSEVSEEDGEEEEVPSTIPTASHDHVLDPDSIIPPPPGW